MPLPALTLVKQSSGQMPVATGRPLSRASMRMEVWVSSPEPAVGGSATPGTCQVRLCLIYCPESFIRR